MSLYLIKYRLRWDSNPQRQVPWTCVYAVPALILIFSISQSVFTLIVARRSPRGGCNHERLSEVEAEFTKTGSLDQRVCHSATWTYGGLYRA